MDSIPRRFKDLEPEEQDQILDQFVRDMTILATFQLGKQHNVQSSELAVLYTVTKHRLGLPPKDSKEEIAYRRNFYRFAKELLNGLPD